MNRLFGFFFGSSLTGAGVYYYVLEEYRVANELLTEDIYVCCSPPSPLSFLYYGRVEERRAPYVVSGIPGISGIVANGVYSLYKQPCSACTPTSRRWRRSWIKLRGGSRRCIQEGTMIYWGLAGLKWTGLDVGKGGDGGGKWRMFSALYGMLDGTVAGSGIGREMYMISMDNLTYIRCFAVICCYLAIFLLFIPPMRASPHPPLSLANLNFPPPASPPTSPIPITTSPPHHHSTSQTPLQTTQHGPLRRPRAPNLQIRLDRVGIHPRHPVLGRGPYLAQTRAPHRQRA